jgi:hypothetical protein
MVKKLVALLCFLGLGGCQLPKIPDYVGLTVKGIPPEDELASVLEETPGGLVEFFLALDNGTEYAGLWDWDEARTHIVRHSHDGTFEGTLGVCPSNVCFTGAAARCIAPAARG